MQEMEGNSKDFPYYSHMNEKIDQFFRPDGSLIKIPARSKKKEAVLNRIAANFSPGAKYPEREVNEIIAPIHADTAAIRRYMIDYGILERDSSSVYWLTENHLPLHGN
jgi:hypothetical protein